MNSQTEIKTYTDTKGNKTIMYTVQKFMLKKPIKIKKPKFKVFNLGKIYNKNH